MRDAEFPRLRKLTTASLGSGAERLVDIRDPLGVAGHGRHGLRVPADVYAIAALFDGRRSWDELAASASDRIGRRVAPDEVQRIAHGFSERQLLDDERFRAQSELELRAFKSSPARPFVGAGSDYEADPIDLRIRIGGLVANDWDMPPPEDPFGVITPAADFTRAGPLYARTYAALRHSGARFERVLLLGALGAPLSHWIVPLDRDFATPFGPLRCDAAGVAALGIDPGTDELAHRGALALERQALFLKLLFPRLPIVPVLVSEPDDDVSVDRTERAVEALARVVSLAGRTLVVCASDLSVVPGPTLAPDVALAVRERDRLAVEAATRVDPEGFRSEIAHLPDPDRTRSFLAPYLFLRLCAARTVDERQPLEGSVLGYSQMNGAEECTTAASVVFH